MIQTLIALILLRDKKKHNNNKSDYDYLLCRWEQLGEQLLACNLHNRIKVEEEGGEEGEERAKAAVRERVMDYEEKEETGLRENKVAAEEAVEWLSLVDHEQKVCSVPLEWVVFVGTIDGDDLSQFWQIFTVKNAQNQPLHCKHSKGRHSFKLHHGGCEDADQSGLVSVWDWMGQAANYVQPAC